MILGQVTGNIWATKKDAGLSGYKLMIVGLMNSKHEFTGQEIIAIDTIGAGIGDQVIISRGSPSRLLNGKVIDSPVDAAIVGIVDTIE